MVDISSQECGYSTIQFTESLNKKPFQPKRRDTKYSEIAHIIQPHALEVPPEAPVPAPRSQSLDRKKNPQLVPCGAESPPQPPPDNSKVDPQQTSAATDPFFGTEDPFANNPFDNDPFADDNADEWRDNTAFYDRPPPPRPYTAGMQVPKPSTPEPGAPLPDEIKFDGEIADCTDESSYQDTKDFLEGVQAKHRGEEFQLGPVSSTQDDDFVLTADLLMPELKDAGALSEPVAKQSPTFSSKSSGAYEYPTVLDKYQKKTTEDPKSSDEPPLHTLTYSKLAPCPAGNLTRSESLRTSAGRRGMPLPPLPDDKEQPHPPAAAAHLDLISPPPLPARPAAAPPGYQAPSLPPFNHPWGNKKSRSEENPPLPPRRKEHQALTPSLSHNGGNESPKLPSGGPPPPLEANPFVTELLALGYTLSEIERALIVSKNDLTLAKLILKEFGGRY